MSEKRWITWAAATLASVMVPMICTSALAAEPIPSDDLAFFEKKIRPVLVERCYKCHSADAEKIKGGLLLDTREGIRKGGDTRHAVVPGNLKDSLLIEAIHYQNEDLKMPPKDPLPAAVVADFEKWVAMGAPDPRDGSSKVVRAGIDIEKGKQFWAFQPPHKSTPPVVKSADWPRGDIDHFILAGLEKKGLQPVADADPLALLRRLYFDLIGLPPSPEQIDAFLADYRRAEANPQSAIQAVVDQLLASPRFGERWGRHWLDVARYAESSGKTINVPFPHAWRYRDYVIESFNADKPYNRFIEEQLAGDLLPAADDQQRAQLSIATGYLAIGPKTLNNRERLSYDLDVADEVLDSVTQGLLGLTVACARCHDHKFDPIPTKDYYSLLGIFRSTKILYGTVQHAGSVGFHSTPLIQLPESIHAPAVYPACTVKDLEASRQRITEMETALAAARKASRDKTTVEIYRLTIQLGAQRNLLATHDDRGNPLPLAMGVTEQESPEDSALFVRGEPDKPGPVIPRGFLQVINEGSESAGISKGSGRRELADWITSPHNPLTARVMANRIWLNLFGRGIVATPDNFGTAGQLPANPELLDYLAVSFVENGWSIKKQIRQIVLSRAYQLSSTFDAKNFAVDPDNVSGWRMTKRLLDAEALRDATLAVSGRLDIKPPIGSVVGRAGDAYPPPKFAPETLNYRSVYLSIYRDILFEPLALFDFADPGTVQGERPATVLPSQALYLLNGPFVMEQSDRLAERLLDMKQSDADRIHLLFQTCYGRAPSANEKSLSLNFVQDFDPGSDGSKTDPAKSRQIAWSCLCQTLLASAEFRSLN